MNFAVTIDLARVPAKLAAISSSANIIAKGRRCDYMVRNGQSIAANAACKTLRILVQFFESKTHSISPNMLAPLYALSTLAIYIVTYPDSRISKMDPHVSGNCPGLRYHPLS
ncbi:fungal specific transcription factor domain-containing protein [Colletotrichum incanum]|uniref:Fungal specific transcription factor domain-containing protein n=1 Tax=Colletotrichum incanum TaxID=1573173 RepID=A0A162Q7W2_COLIC|nr:fungal specific transcription factor domain-containing protein [Colletotrichum incanum]